MMNRGKLPAFAAILTLLAAMTACSDRAYAANTKAADAGNAASVNKPRAFPDGVFRISSGGSYSFSGEYVGQILVEAAEHDEVTLVLEGFTLTNPKGPAIFAPRSASVRLLLADGTENSISGGGRAAVHIHNDLIISGNGTLIINSERNHGIQADASVTINGGTILITAKGNAITSNGPALVTGGVIRVIDSYEGIEALNVTITGGDIDIFARDDGINARDSGEPTGGTRGRFGINPEIFVRIAGGNVRLHALRDGIDSNGNTFLEGGTLHISAPSLRFGDDAIDQDGVFVVSGGELVTAGTVRSVSPRSAQPVLLFSYWRRMPNGARIEVMDLGGTVILAYTSRVVFSLSAFTSPRFTVGGKFFIYINGERITTVTLHSLITVTR